MSLFRTIGIFETQEGDVYEQMCKSTAYIQAIYCFPVPSEYFAIIEQKISENRSYFESHIIFNDEEKYKEWYSIFGEICEELMEEIDTDFTNSGIKYRRFFEKVEIAKAANAEPIEDFVSKFNDNNKPLDLLP